MNKEALKIIKKLLQRNPSMKPQAIEWELRFLHRINLSQRTVSRYINLTRKELAAKKPKPKPIQKPIPPEKAEKVKGITCPLCGKLLHFDNPNPIALIGCAGGNHPWIHYNRQTREWRYVHNNALYGKKKAQCMPGYASF